MKGRPSTTQYLFAGRMQTVREIAASLPAYSKTLILKAVQLGAQSVSDIERVIAQGEARRRKSILRNRFPPMWPEPNRQHTSLPAAGGRLIRL